MANKVFFGKKRPEEEAMGGGGALAGRSIASNGQMGGKLGGEDPRMATMGGMQTGGAAHGIPGVQRTAQLTPEMEQMLLTQKKDQAMITDKDVHRAEGILEKYRQGKKNLERQVVENEQWWKLQHWELMGKKDDGSPKPTSAWLFNSIHNKHADMMDNIPEPIVLPREQSDEANAKTLSEVLPVVFKYNGFEKTYSDNCWEKLKHGTAVYGVFWDSQKDGGLGDVVIPVIDLLKIYWEPGVTDIQKSRNLFIIELVDSDLLDRQYPEHAGRFKGNSIDVAQYKYDEDIDTSDKTVVVDWYYKVSAPGGRTALHYVKFAGGRVLYASQNDPNYRDRGYYDHGLYPVVFDVLFPEKGMPTGFGFVSICKNPQLYVDKLWANILETSLQNTKRRFFADKGLAINKEQLLDTNEVLIETEGAVTNETLREFAPRDLPGIYPNILQMRIEEMKDTSGNRDVNSGGTGGGVTAASAIAALQEAGNKGSRDIISASYRSFVAISSLVIEVMRQFYTEARSFRITNKPTTPEQLPGMMPGMAPAGMPMQETAQGGLQNGAAAPNQPSYQFVEFDGRKIAEQKVGLSPHGEPIFRKPIFDLEIKAQKKSPWSVMSQNELIKELLDMGAFNPEKAQEMLIAIDLMEFEGKEKVMDYVKQGQTLLNMLHQAQKQIVKYEAILAQLGLLPGMPTGQGGAPGGASGGAPRGSVPRSPITDGVMQAQTPKSSYAEALVKRSTPSVE